MVIFNPNPKYVCILLSDEIYFIREEVLIYSIKSNRFRSPLSLVLMSDYVMKDNGEVNKSRFSTDKTIKHHYNLNIIKTLKIYSVADLQQY